METLNQKVAAIKEFLLTDLNKKVHGYTASGMLDQFAGQHIYLCNLLSVFFILGYNLDILYMQ
jgi:hypothetical protein